MSNADAHVCQDCAVRVVRTGTRGNWPKRCPECRRAVRRDRARARVKKWQTDNPERYRQYQRAYAAENAAAARERARAWRAANPGRVSTWKPSPEQARGYYLKYAFGITLADQRRMLLEQGGKCAICAELLTDETLAVDHNHETGEVRGLLCKLCNSSLGQFERDPERLLRAFEYLTESRRLRLLQEEGK